ncbi:MAG: hypothetical protein J2P52_06305 [Blastocatellia bacterium]|nr:hypothetical protein [Blastocatellia bacterium]
MDQRLHEIGAGLSGSGWGDTVLILIAPKAPWATLQVFFPGDREERGRH